MKALDSKGTDGLGLLGFALLRFRLHVTNDSVTDELLSLFSQRTHVEVVQAVQSKLKTFFFFFSFL